MSGIRPKSPRATLLDRTGISGTSMLHRLGGRAEIPAPAPETEQAAPPAFPSGSRRLSDIPRDLQRPLESRLYHLRRVWNLTDEEISHKLDLRREDLDALARTAGMP